MKSLLFLSLLLGELFLISTGQGVIYCVKPNSTATCSYEDHCQQCQTLQYYIDNMDTTINQQNNVTMIFMDGTHTTNFTLAYYQVSVPTLTMKGKSQNNVSVIIKGTTPSLAIVFSANMIDMENITMINLIHYFGTVLAITGKEVFLKDCTFQDFEMEINNAANMMLDNCECRGQKSNFYISRSTNAVLKKCKFADFAPYYTKVLKITGTTDMIIEDCDIHNVSADIRNSSAVIKGDTNFSACLTPAISIDVSNITLSGKVTFANNIEGAVILYSSTLTITSGANVNFTNNSVMDSGGAIYLNSSPFYVESGANITFVNNSAFDRGGAIFVKPGIPSDATVSRIGRSSANFFHNCFFHPLYLNDSEITISFDRNVAGNGGDDIYGASLEDCYSYQTDQLKIDRVGPPSVSSVSSDPLRVCLCDSHGVPQCEISKVYQNVHPGESFTVPAVLVGWDYKNGATTGVVYAEFLSKNKSINAQLDSTSQNGHVISNSKQCTNLTFSLFSSETPQNATMYITPMHRSAHTVLEYTDRYCFRDRNCIHLTPVFFYITLLPCPPGFTLHDERCTCYLEHVFFENCNIANGIGYFSWNETAWVTINGEAIQYNTHCPFDYCNIAGKEINLQNDSDSQCAFNRAGRLCGGCKENYSLAIGSSHCIHCPNNNNLALLIFFAAAGFLLVFFISAFNLTVTQGMINGLIFYANIVWTYQNIFFPQELEPNPVLVFLKTFIAWINLDFGIETCFVDGLDAFWKTWLQFIFPFYILAIAGLIIVATRHSTRLTNLLGDTAVPVLNTLFLISYMKLLRTTVSIMQVSILQEYPTSSKLYVWSADGNLSYCGFPHIFLFLAGLATLLVGLIFILVLFSMQWLQRYSHLYFLKWITRFKPVYDACFAPLKHKHQYWFGMLLLARGILLLTFTLSFATPQSTSLLILLIFVVSLSFYMAHSHPYKSKAVLLVNNSFLLNLTILSGFTIYARIHPNAATLLAVTIGLSTGVAFLQFCGIVFYSILAPRCSTDGMLKCCTRMKKDAVEQGDDGLPRPFVYQTGYRDSIFDDSQPLLPTN